MAVTSDRWERAALKQTGTSGFCLLCLSALAIVPAAPDARAGTVFMKNGYLIQGPVVEHSADSVVLGWPNGKVTIYRRFFDKVDLEPGEEKNFRAEEKSGPSIDEAELVTPPSGDEELPQNLSDLVKTYHLPVDANPGAVAAPDVDPTQPPPDATPPQGGEPTAVATTVPSEEAGLGDRATGARWGFSIRPPTGWKVAEVEGCVSWTGQAGTDGFAPSISVTSAKRGDLKWEDATKMLREDQQTPIRDYKLIAEEAVEVGGRPAYQVAGQGNAGARASPKKKAVKVRQVLLEEGERYWLISSFLHVNMPEEVAGVLDRSIQTFKVEG